MKCHVQITINIPLHIYFANGGNWHYFFSFKNIANTLLFLSTLSFNKTLGMIHLTIVSALFAFYFIVYGMCLSEWMYVHHNNAEPCKGQKRHWISCNWSYRWLLNTMCVLGDEPGYLKTHVLNRWVIFLGPYSLYF